MNTGEDIQGMRKIQDLSRWISVALLLLHIYYYCYAAFRQWHLSSLVFDRVLENIAKTKLFANSNTSKLLILAFLALSLMGSRGKKHQKFSYTGGLACILTGLLLYFGSFVILSPYFTADRDTTVWIYTAVIVVGYLLILSGGVICSRVLAASLRKDFFNDNNTGFLQEERLISTDFSLHLPAQYQFRGKTRKSHINFINPRRGILIMGSPGSGKSWFIIEQLLHQLSLKGFALFVYDFKYDALTSLVYNQYLINRSKYPPTTRFYSINFSDLSRSNRCNMIAPETMVWMSDAIGASRTILLSMNKTWVNRQGEFFVESPINFLAALIWWLRKHRGGVFCTLPHAIELAQIGYDKLFTILSVDPEIQNLINSFKQAYLNNSMELVDSQVSSAKIPLSRLSSPDLYYILTGNDCSLDLNDPAAPKIICLGGDPPRQEALAPVLSLYIDRINKLVNRPGKHPCALVCDEFATVRASSVLTTIATARSNNIIPILAVQDLSQLRTQYSREEADLILNITGNLICGQVGGETARWVSERFPGTLQYKTTVSVNSSDTSISKAEQMTNAISPATIATLSSGQFVGITADDPDKELALKAFHTRVIRNQKVLLNKDQAGWQALPVIHDVTSAEVEENFHRVKREVLGLVDDEVRRIMADPALVKMVVKK